VLPLVAFQGAVNIFSAFYINNEHRFDFLFKKNWATLSVGARLRVRISTLVRSLQ
jgi:hypothetical protein